MPREPRPPDPLSRLLGLDLVGRRPGYARLECEVRAEHCNAYGHAHGGLLFSLADTAMGVASNTHGPRAVGLAASIHLTRAARVGETLVAEATELSLGPRAASYEVQVRAGTRLLAAFTGTVYRQRDG
jgi:phenylacetic acid degradation protein PaaD